MDTPSLPTSTHAHTAHRAIAPTVAETHPEAILKPLCSLESTSSNCRPAPAAASSSESADTASHSSTTGHEKKCAATTRSGAPCRAYSRPGLPVCIYHDPGYRQALRESGARGGHATREHHAVPYAGVDLTDPLSRLRLTEHVLRLYLGGAISGQQADQVTRLLLLAQRSL